MEYDDGFQKAIHQSKIREKDTTAKVRNKTVKCTDIVTQQTNSSSSGSG